MLTELGIVHTHTLCIPFPYNRIFEVLYHLSIYMILL